MSRPPFKKTWMSLGISSLAGAHIAFVSKLTQKAQAKAYNLSDVVLLVGGIIPDDDRAALKRMGVSATFGPGTSVKEIANYIRGNVKPRQVITGAG